MEKKTKISKKDLEGYFKYLKKCVVYSCGNNYGTDHKKDNGFCPICRERIYGRKLRW